ncbi:MAG: glycosyltransferase family 9 protein [Ignavibacteriaceae bacterium]
MKKIEIFFKNILLKILLAIAKFNRPKNNQNLNNFSRILFIRLNRIGDALVATPLLHRIKVNLNSKIYVLADKKNYFAFNNNSDVDKLLVFKKGIKGILEVIEFIKRERIDTIVDLHDDVSTTVSFIIALSNASNKLGLEKENKIIYTQTVKKLDVKSNHVVERILELSKLFNISKDKSEIKIHYNLKSESIKKAEEFLKSNFREDKFLIGINISAGNESRFWGVNNFKLLLDFLSNYDLNIILLCAPNDLNLAMEISNKIAVFYSKVFDEFAAMIFKLNLLFTPDTMAIHLAAANEVTVFGMYVHDTEAMIWSPYNTDFKYISTNSPSLKNISFNEVKSKLQPLIDMKMNKITSN